MADLVDYWLTFRIESVTVGGVTSTQRRDALYAAIREVCGSWWIEPTSFIFFDSTQSMSALASKCKAAISPAHDLVIIRKLNVQEARAIGKVQDIQMLKAFMPYLSTV